ncbi:hypothetical protein HGRIS_008932 [Hohenbuehelia grisea]
MQAIVNVLHATASWWDDKEIVARVLGSWPDLWVWCKLLLSDVVRARLRQVQSQLFIPKDFCSMLHDLPLILATYFLDCAKSNEGASKLFSVIGDSDSFLAVITAEWLRPDDTSCISSPSAIISIFAEERSKKWDDRIISGAGGIPRLVKIIIERINAAQTLDEPKCTNLARDIAVLVNLSFTTDSIAYALTAENAVLALVRLMKRLLPIGTEQYKAICVSLCLQLFVVNIKKKGFRDRCLWVRKLLSAEELILPRLLKALLKPDKSPHPLSIHQLGIDLLSGLIPYLIYRPLLRPALKSIRVVADAGFEKDLERVPVLGKLWTAFRDIAKYREQFKSLANSGVLMCQCNQCEKPDIDDKFAACEGCLSAMYCSKECQRKNWPAHREWCKETRAMSKEAGVPSFGERDACYMEGVIQNDLRVLASQVRAAKLKFKKENPLADPHAQLLRLDYRVYPPTIRLLPFVDFLRVTDPRTQAVFKESMEEVKFERGSVIMVIANLPGCGRTFNRVIAGVHTDDEGMPRDVEDEELSELIKRMGKLEVKPEDRRRLELEA